MKLNQKKIFAIIFTLSFLGACSTFGFYNVPIVQGNLYEEEDLENLAKGLSKDQVKFILGTAMIQDPFHKNRWDYVNKVTIGDLVISDKKLTLYFDSNELLDSWVLENTQ